MLEILAIPPILFCLLMFSGALDLLYSTKDLKYTFSPTQEFFPSYLAGKITPRNTLSVRTLPYTDIVHAGKLRYGIGLGGQFKIMKYTTQEPAPRGMQFNFSASMTAQTDLEEGLDVIGWDGVMLSETAFSIGKSSFLKFGVFHISGHIGDEYLQKVKRKRQSYARNELTVAISHHFFYNFRTYFESGYDYSTNRAAPDDPYRFQFGIEYLGENALKEKRLAPFAAVDFESYQEDNWKLNKTYQLGGIVRANDFSRTYRIYLEHYTGKSQMTEFFNQTEKHYSIALAFDF